MLVKQAQAGDREAFAMLVKRHYGMMFKTAWHYCGDRDEAADIAQEASIRLAKGLDGFRFESAFTTWLYRLVLNIAKDYFRAKTRRDGPIQEISGDNYASAALSPEQKLAEKDVQKAVGNLPDDLKDSVILCYWRGLSHKEASVVLQCSEGTISWRLHEARKKLGIVLGGEGKEARHG